MLQEDRRALYSKLTFASLRHLGFRDGARGDDLDERYFHLDAYRLAWHDGFRDWAFRQPKQPGSPATASSTQPVLGAASGADRLWEVRVRGAREWQFVVRSPTWFSARIEASRQCGMDRTRLQVRPRMDAFSRCLYVGAAAVVGMLWLGTLS